MKGNDKVTLKDLSVFSADGTHDIFSLINKTNTKVGERYLAKYIEQTPPSYSALIQVQELIKFWAAHQDLWPHRITNGTIVMLEKFFEAADEFDERPSGLSMLLGALFQKWFNRNQYSYIRFSLSHLSDFFASCNALAQILNTHAPLPQLLKADLELIQAELNDNELVSAIQLINPATAYNQLLKLGFEARRFLKDKVYRLIEIYSRLDAYFAMAKATYIYAWQFPQILPQDQLCFTATQLYHPLLQTPVPYDLDLNADKNFMILTGANMSGKTTFMRSVGVASLLAHLGMGVPAKTLAISFLSGIISNMQVEDNILLGESYFFAEVQRMKIIGQKMQKDAQCLILMDELFKGTNVHDAYDCTKAVVEKLLGRKEHLMILSTHLHELALHFANNNHIAFAYFHTLFNQDHTFTFTYQLKSGISNDKLGYRILQKEGVLDILGTENTING